MKAAHIFKEVLLAVLLLVFSLSAWAENWSLKDTAGVRYTLVGLQGKWVLVNFWAPWCPTCIQELPELVSMQKQHNDLRVLGVAVMYKNRKEVIDMAQSYAVSYPLIFGNEDIASDFGGMSGLPTSFLYSPAGKLVSRFEGPVTKNEVEKAMTQK